MHAIMQDILFLALGLGAFALFLAMLWLLDERVLDRRR
jgi:hypothetical protein